MQAAARTKLNFTAQDHNAAEFDFLEADRGGLSGSYPFVQAQNKPPEYAKTLSNFAPRVVTGQSKFGLPAKIRQGSLARRGHSKYQAQQKQTHAFGWTPNLHEPGMLYAIGAWIIFALVYAIRK
jgi:hypothetical protein